MSNPQFAMFSGGRSSLVMVDELLSRGERLDAVLFCNTGGESKQTYAFIHAADAYLRNRYSLPITLLEYSQHKPYWGRVDTPAQLRTNWAPFNECVKKHNMVPSLYRRFCTQYMKVECATYYIRHLLGTRDLWNVVRCVGLRAGEDYRVSRARVKEETLAAWDNADRKSLTNHQKRMLSLYGGRVRHPLYDWDWDASHVMQRIAELAVLPEFGNLDYDPHDKSILLSNCSGCFAKPPIQRSREIQAEPAAGEFWERVENMQSASSHKRNARAIELNKIKILEFRSKYRSLANKEHVATKPAGCGFWSGKWYPIVWVHDLSDAMQGKAGGGFAGC